MLRRDKERIEKSEAINAKGEGNDGERLGNDGTEIGEACEGLDEGWRRIGTRFEKHRRSMRGDIEKGGKEWANDGKG